MCAISPVPLICPVFSTPSPTLPHPTLQRSTPRAQQRRYNRLRETKDAIIKRQPQFYANRSPGAVAGGGNDYGSIDAPPVVNDRSASVSASISRYKYYNKLAPFEDTPFVMPDHVVPSNFFIIIPVKRGEGQSSLITIFSIWNTMMGTSLLAMPWAMTQVSR